MKSFPYSSIFGEILVKSIVSEDKDKYLSKASLAQLQQFIPNVDTERNYDLLPVSFSAAVVNRINKNRHVITTATALKIYKTFINKPINVEHSRQKIVGCILTAGFSEFGTEKLLTKDEVKDMKGPFNITLGGIIWRNVSEDLTDYIEECADPSSESYLNVSASWELGYGSFDIVKIKGSGKNIEDGELITDKDEIEKHKNLLTAFGGNGKQDDYNYYLAPSRDVLAVGIGLTESPAADVQGVAVKEEEEKQTEATIKIETKQENNEDLSSQAETQDVKEDRINMKITSVKDITDENLKVVTASAVVDFVQSEINKLNEQYVAEKQAKENEVKAQKEAVEKANSDLEKVNTQLTQVQNKLNEMQSTVAAKAKEETFTQRMAEFDEEFNLDDEDRSVIASQIKDLNDEAFAAFKKNAKVFFKNRKKGAEKTEDKKETKEAKASVEVEDKKEDVKDVVEDAISKGKEETLKLPNTPSTKEPTLKEKWATAFAPENILIKTVKNR